MDNTYKSRSYSRRSGRTRISRRRSSNDERSRSGDERYGSDDERETGDHRSDLLRHDEIADRLER